MKLSIILPYYNRRNLILNTLKSIDCFARDKDIEVIAVDDGSDEEQHIRDFRFKNFGFTILKLERDPVWRGPCMAYNIGFNAATGDVIMINSSECIHIGNIIGYVFENFKSKDYICFSANMGKPEHQERLNNFDWSKPFVAKRLKELIDPIKNWWGCHSTIGNYIPYCAVISKEDMEILGGYDSRFAIGVGYDDYDFFHRVKNLKLNMSFVDDPFCFHQWHKLTVYPNTINIDLLNRLNKEFPDRIKAE